MISDDVKKAFELGKKEGREETKKWIEGLIDERINHFDSLIKNNPNHEDVCKFGDNILNYFELKKQISGEGKGK